MSVQIVLSFASHFSCHLFLFCSEITISEMNSLKSISKGFPSIGKQNHLCSQSPTYFFLAEDNNELRHGSLMVLHWYFIKIRCFATLHLLLRLQESLLVVGALYNSFLLFLLKSASNYIGRNQENEHGTAHNANLA